MYRLTITILFIILFWKQVLGQTYILTDVRTMYPVDDASSLTEFEPEYFYLVVLIE